MTTASAPLHDLILCDLRDRPLLLDAVVTQNLRSWGGITALDQDEMAAQFPVNIARGQLPATFVAVLGGRYAGCVSLREQTLGAVKHPELYGSGTPWLSNMWVAEWARGHGLAGALTARVMTTAQAMGFVRLYSSTATGSSLYHKMGFRTYATRRFGDETIHLIEHDLAGAAVAS